MRCRLMRQYSWMARAAHEQAFAKKTWFITFTYKPAVRVKIMARASDHDRAKPQGARLVQASGVYVSKCFKRLRKAGFVFRYVCVPEPHRDGFPHWHGLVHDLTGDLTWDAITKEWRSGFSVVKLVQDVNAIRYVTKYLAKADHGRVRASLKYGETEADRELMRAEREASPEPTGDGLEEKSSASSLPLIPYSLL